MNDAGQFGAHASTLDGGLAEGGLDPQRLERERAARARRLHTVQIPAARLIGFLMLCGLLLLHRPLDGGVASSNVGGLIALNLAYAALAWWALRQWWLRLGRLDLSLLLLHLDLLVWLPTLQHLELNGASYAMLLLLARVADQVGFGARRAFYFSHVVVTVFIGWELAMVLSGAVPAVSRERWLMAGTLHLVGLYISLTGLVTEGLRRRVRIAVRTGRALVDRLTQQAAALEQQAAELERARRQAEQASVAKSQFLATISHELRTPMSGILGTTELMLDSGLPEDQRRLAGTAHGSARALLGIIDDILDISRIEAGQLRLESTGFDPRQLASEVIELMTPAARARGLNLAAELPLDLPKRVIGDPLRLRQVLVNLVANALKFTERGGVTLVMHNEPTPSGAPAAARSYAWMYVEVRDSGIGIEAPDLSRIFDPFTQVDASARRRHGGSGLGLAIARELVQRMGGQIGVRSRVGVGSVFWLRLGLPRAVGTQPDVPVGLVPEELPRLQGRVLLAEDNEINQIVLRAMLERLGCSVDVVPDGRRALEAVDVAPPDLVLMDGHMPVLDGYESTRRLREWQQRAGHARLPIIALSAATSPEDRRRFLEAGMDEFLSKPVGLVDLAAALARHLPRRDPEGTPEGASLAAGPAAEGAGEGAGPASPLRAEGRGPSGEDSAGAPN